MEKINTAYGEFWIYPGETVSEHIKAGGFWDEFIRVEFDKVPAGGVVVDVGAFIGWFSIYAAKLGCKVYAFEASPDNYKVLLDNIILNGVQKLVTAYNVPLFSEVNMNMKIHVSGNMLSGWAVVPAAPEDVVYKSRTLDSFDLKNVGLIKIDAQACDLHVMRGARETIKAQTPVICFEIEHSGTHLHNETVEDYAKFVEEIGYQGEAVYHGPSSEDWVIRPKEAK